jgi:hypothetical protein
MATVNVIDSNPPISIETNTWGAMSFQDVDSLQTFTRETSSRLASLLHVLATVNQEIDGGFMTDVLKLANDMAFQLQGATEILTHEPCRQ